MFRSVIWCAQRHSSQKHPTHRLHRYVARPRVFFWRTKPNIYESPSRLSPFVQNSQQFGQNYHSTVWRKISEPKNPFLSQRVQRLDTEFDPREEQMEYDESESLSFEPEAEDEFPFEMFPGDKIEAFLNRVGPLGAAVGDTINKKLSQESPKDSSKDIKMEKKLMKELAKKNSANFSLRLGTVSLPKQLEERIYLLLRDYPRGWLRQHAASLSQTLRARTTTQSQTPKFSKDLSESWQSVQHFQNSQDEWQQHVTKTSVEQGPEKSNLAPHDKKLPDIPPLQYQKHESLAYVAHRVPGIYGCNYKVLYEVKVRFPQFNPQIVVDFGSGPGTAIWATHELWPNVKEFHAIEPSDAMTEISKVLLDGFPMFRRKFLHEGKLLNAHLVIASYSLSEMMSDAMRRSVLRELWFNLAPGGVLVLIEPGTPIGFKIIRAARTYLLQLENQKQPQFSPRIVAPCPHALACPMAQKSWCHFVQRIQRLPILKHSKSRATLNWENEKFSYLIISKGPLSSPLPKDHPNYGLQWSRLTQQPIKRKGHIILDVCAPDGHLKREIVTKKHTKEIFRAARKAFWGDMFYLDRILKTPPKGPRKYFPTTKKRKKELRKLVKYKKRLQKLADSKQQHSSTPFSPPSSPLSSSNIKHPIR